jgi:hypothetical protein
MTDKVIPITIERRRELKKGLLYDYEETFVRSTLLVEDSTLREGIDAATEYLESKGRKIRSILNNKFLLLVVFIVGFSLGTYLTLMVLYLARPEEMSAILGF